MVMIELKPMKDAPRFGGEHIIGVTNYDQNWVIAWDGKKQAWLHGHGPLDVVGDDYFKGWLPYHGEEVWKAWALVESS